MLCEMEGRRGGKLPLSFGAGMVNVLSTSTRTVTIWRRSWVMILDTTISGGVNHLQVPDM